MSRIVCLRIARPLAFLTLFCIALSACAAQTLEPTRSPSPEATITKSATSLPAATPTPISPPAPPHCPAVLLARDRFLWRTNVDGDAVEQLTHETRLPWQPGKEEEDWWMSFLLRPVQVSPDGRWITFLPQYERFLFDVTTHARVNIPGRGATVVDWSPDSRYMTYAVAKGSEDVLYAYDVQQAQTTELLTLPKLSADDPGITSVVWSPDGRFIGFGCCYAMPADVYTGTLNGQIRQIEIATGQVEAVGETRLHVAASVPVCWTDRGQLTTDANQGVRCAGHRPSLLIAPISPDGAKRVSYGPSLPDDVDWTGATLLTVSEAMTEEVLWQREIEWRVSSVSWSTDGQYLLYDDNQDGSPIWRVSADGSGDSEMVIENGFLLGVIPQWCSSEAISTVQP
ncbi:MAG: hypothetical protein JXR84_01950 [Anaerolineae bacterium]|nr:hypothetical protein [Anaerolineae bacterium]